MQVQYVASILSIITPVTVDKQDIFSFLVERQALAVRLDLCFRSVYFIFLSGNIFRTTEPISTKDCTVTATG